MAEGVTLEGTMKSRWRIGSVLGSGTFGKVHELFLIEDESTTSAVSKKKPQQWVAKVCPVPTAGKKANHKILKRAADSIYFESLIYQNKLQRLQGSFLPYVPSFAPKKSGQPQHALPPTFGNTAGYQYLVMERMEFSLQSLVPKLVPTAKASTSRIEIGPIAAQLVRIIEAVHEQKHLVIDVKPENFMFAPGGGGRSNSCTNTNNVTTLASRLRMVDLGLITSYLCTTGHRPDEENSELLGTALYSSLNVHAGHLLSRRDDVEAVGYVIAELVIAVNAAIMGNTESFPKYHGMPSYLPWGTAKSEQDLGKLKEEHVTSRNSQFYNSMGHDESAASNIIFDYLQRVRGLEYKARPDYDSLCKLLLPLTVDLTNKGNRRTPLRDNVKHSPRPIRAIAKKAPVTRRTKHQPEEDDNETSHYDDVKRITRKRIKMDKSKLSYASTEEVVEAEDMEVEYYLEDPNLSTTVQLPRTASPAPVHKNGGAMILEVLNGCRAGEQLVLRPNETDVVVIGTGRGPPPSSSRRTAGKLETFPNDQMASYHARLTLHVRKETSFSVQVHDLKTDEGTCFNFHPVAPGKQFRAFSGDRIQLGETHFVLKRIL